MSICDKQKCLFKAYARPKKEAEMTKMKSRMGKGLKSVLLFLQTDTKWYNSTLVYRQKLRFGE